MHAVLLGLVLIVFRGNGSFSAAPRTTAITDAAFDFSDPAPQPDPSPANPLTPPPAPTPRTQTPPSLLPQIQDSLPGWSETNTLENAWLPSIDTNTWTPPRTQPSTIAVDFAGENATARDVVYVVDATGSMLTVFPDALRILRNSIDQLEPTQRFQILFFQGKGSNTRVVHAPIPPATNRPLLLHATSDTTARIDAWTKTITPKGRANPLPALRAALQLQPDIVFLLACATEADRNDVSVAAMLKALDTLNPADSKGRRRTPIRTIQALREDPTGLMRAIGTTHGGPNGYTLLEYDALAPASRTQPPQP